MNVDISRKHTPPHKWGVPSSIQQAPTYADGPLFLSSSSLGLGLGEEEELRCAWPHLEREWLGEWRLRRDVEVDYIIIMRRVLRGWIRCKCKIRKRRGDSHSAINCTRRYSPVWLQFHLRVNRRRRAHYYYIDIMDNKTANWVGDSSRRCVH